MIICTNCQARQLEGSIFCSECGASIIALPPQQMGAQAAMFDAPGAPRVNEPPLAQTVIPSLTLVVSSNGRRLMVRDIDDTVLIGRRDDARGVYPGVDLGAEGGYEAGVSRKHAALFVRHGTYYVEDLGSANGTFVNGRQITPQTPTPMAHGDELRCGMLLLRVELK